MAVSRYGVGAIPLRAVVTGNLVNWTICSVFVVRSSIVMVIIGMAVWLGLVPVIEAAEQTILQRAIPYERQGTFQVLPPTGRLDRPSRAWTRRCGHDGLRSPEAVTRLLAVLFTT